MSSAVVTALLFSVVLLIIASLVFSVLLEHRRYKRNLQVQASQATQVPDTHVAIILNMQDSVVMGVEKPSPVPMFTLPSSWYTRRKTVVSLSFLLMLFITLFLQSGLADGALQSLSHSLSLFSTYQSSDVKAVSHPLPLTASLRLVRVDSAARNQYYTDYQWQVWSYASCSGISMEEVMNSYGRHLIAADVLQVELNMGIWNTYQGLTGGEPGIAKAANYFGFKADPHPPRTLSALIYITNKGFPVIVGIPGHILVVRGGDSNYIYLADSAPANRTIMTHQQFMSLWNNFSVLLTPQ
ncbi:MAG: cysteine peptidase family C39 domain-containing protein [Ktedonobacteraceae bacterium]